MRGTSIRGSKARGSTGGILFGELCATAQAEIAEVILFHVPCGPRPSVLPALCRPSWLVLVGGVLSRGFMLVPASEETPRFTIGRREMFPRPPALPSPTSGMSVYSSHNYPAVDGDKRRFVWHGEIPATVIEGLKSPVCPYCTVLYCDDLWRKKERLHYYSILGQKQKQKAEAKQKDPSSVHRYGVEANGRLRAAQGAAKSVRCAQCEH